ncbi:MAG: hypothetical protein QG626_310 [Patescibacteria group bacterium]|nr:hypothetical protein [Patescibacteria group bacterium]
MLLTVDFLTLKQQHAMQLALSGATDDDITAMGAFLAAYLRAEKRELTAREL